MDSYESFIIAYLAKGAPRSSHRLKFSREKLPLGTWAAFPQWKFQSQLPEWAGGAGAGSGDGRKQLALSFGGTDTTEVLEPPLALPINLLGR